MNFANYNNYSTFLMKYTLHYWKFLHTYFNHIFDELRKIFVSAWVMVSTLFWSVDVNSTAWRNNVPDENYAKLSQKKNN